VTSCFKHRKMCKRSQCIDDVRLQGNVFPLAPVVNANCGLWRQRQYIMSDISASGLPYHADNGLDITLDSGFLDRLFI
jgi:hypothetical protein